MKKNTQQYIDNNDKKYKYYIMNVRGKFSVFISAIVIVLVEYLILRIREIFLRRNLLDEAGEQIIENMEVTQWIEEELSRRQYDEIFFFITAVIIFMIAIVVITNFVIKSYDLYKMRWLKWLPTLLVVIILASLFSEYNTEYILLFVLSMLELIPLSLTFNLFLPLEIREEVGTLVEAASGLGNLIIKKM